MVLHAVGWVGFGTHTYREIENNYLIVLTYS